MLQNLLLLIFRSSTVLLFLLLEGICFYMIIQLNEKQGSLFFSSANNVSGSIYRRYDKITDFWRLNDQIEDLSAENAQLRRLLDHSIYNISFTDNLETHDSLRQKFIFTAAKVINKTNIGTKNILTIDKGEEQNIIEDSGVIMENGIVGFVRNVGSYYSTVMSILHTDARVSAAIKNESAHGSLVWRGGDTRYMYLEGIPSYETVAVGDTIVTSGYSNKFPPGIEIGTVADWKVQDGQIDYNIKVKLNYNYFKTNHVFVVTNLMRDELQEIQEGLE